MARSDLVCRHSFSLVADVGGWGHFVGLLVVASDLVLHRSLLPSDCCLGGVHADRSICLRYCRCVIGRLVCSLVPSYAAVRGDPNESCFLDLVEVLPD